MKKYAQKTVVKHCFCLRGQASIEYLLLVSLLILLVAFGIDHMLLSSLNIYFQDIVSVLKLPIP